MNMALLKQIGAAILLGLAFVLATGFLADAIFQNGDSMTGATSGPVAGQPVAEEPANFEEPPVAEPVAAEPVAAEAVEPETLGDLLASVTADQGQRLYGRCRACHDVSDGGNHKIGPNLYGIVGADVARFGDYKYSDALLGYGGTWTPALLDAWLASPKEAISGNKMTFGGLADPADRAALIVYLNEMSEAPIDLSE